MKFRNIALKYAAGLTALVATGSASATSLIPAATLTALGTDLTDTFDAGISWAYPIMLTFVGGTVAFMLVKRLIKMGAKT